MTLCTMVFTMSQVDGIIKMVSDYLNDIQTIFTFIPYHDGLFGVDVFITITNKVSHCVVMKKISIRTHDDVNGTKTFFESALNDVLKSIIEMTVSMFMFAFYFFHLIQAVYLEVL